MARFHYDSFGVLRTATGPAAALPSDVGGDFRFHGTWLEATTGLYHMRARQYDPHTGRFLSRDPAEPNLWEPESLHPYEFAYGNPHLYRDPTGTLTLYELNVSRSSQDVLRQVRSLAIRELSDYVKGRVGEVVTNLLDRFLQGLLPDSVDLSQVDKLKDPRDQGNKLTTVLQQALCFLIPDTTKHHTSLRFEVPLSRTGDPTGNGVQCPGGTIGGSNNSADYVFSRQEPIKLTSQGRTRHLGGGLGAFKAWLIGDFKLSINTMYNKYHNSNNSQWKAITGFARRYQYVPLILFVTIYDNSSENKKRTLAANAVKAGVAMVIVVLR